MAEVDKNFEFDRATILLNLSNSHVERGFSTSQITVIALVNIILKYTTYHN